MTMSDSETKLGSETLQGQAKSENNNSSTVIKQTVVKRSEEGTTSGVRALNDVDKKRSQRFLGVMMGTLSKFQTESRNKTEADLKRESINQKLQVKLQKEKEEIQEKLAESKRQRQLWQEEATREREKKESERVAEIKRQDEASRRNFLGTNAEPKIFYLPRKLIPELETQLLEQKNHYEERT